MWLGSLHEFERKIELFHEEANSFSHTKFTSAKNTRRNFYYKEKTTLGVCFVKFMKLSWQNVYLRLMFGSLSKMNLLFGIITKKVQIALWYLAAEATYSYICISWPEPGIPAELFLEKIYRLVGEYSDKFTSQENLTWISLARVHFTHGFQRCDSGNPYDPWLFKLKGRAGWHHRLCIISSCAVGHKEMSSIFADQ